MKKEYIETKKKIEHVEDLLDLADAKIQSIEETIKNFSGIAENKSILIWKSQLESTQLAKMRLRVYLQNKIYQLFQNI